MIALCTPQYHDEFDPLPPQADEYVVYSPHQQQMQYLVEFTLPVDSEEQEHEGERETEEGRVEEAGGESEGEQEREEKDEGEGEGEGREDEGEEGGGEGGEG